MSYGMNGANGKTKKLHPFFCDSPYVNNRNYVIEVDSKHILFDHSPKSRLVSWQFSLKSLGRTLRS